MCKILRDTEAFVCGIYGYGESEHIIGLKEMFVEAVTNIRCGKRATRSSKKWDEGRFK